MGSKLRPLVLVAPDQPRTAATRRIGDAELADVRDRLAAAVGRICPSWLAAQRDDIVQEAMVRVLHAIERTDGDINSAYVWRVGYSATIDEIRKARRRREQPLDDDAPEPGPQSERPDRVLFSKRVRVAIRDCLAGVAEARRRALTLYLLGHRVPDVAERLAAPPKRAENLVYRGLADLRRCLSGKGVTV